MPDRPAILLTRPAALSAELAGEIGDLPARIVISPAMAIVPLPDLPPPPAQAALILTSGHGAALAGARGWLDGRPVYAVGRKTAEIAGNAGAVLRGVAADADELVGLILRDRPQKFLVHLCGRHVAGQVAERLNSAGIETIPHPIYDQPEQEMTAEARAILAEPGDVILPVFSPRSAAILSLVCAKARPAARLHLLSISPGAEASWSGPNPETRCLAARPDGNAMIAGIRKLVADLA